MSAHGRPYGSTPAERIRQVVERYEAVLSRSAIERMIADLREAVAPDKPRRRIDRQTIDGDAESLAVALFKQAGAGREGVRWAALEAPARAFYRRLARVALERLGPARPRKQRAK